VRAGGEIPFEHVRPREMQALAPRGEELAFGEWAAIYAEFDASCVRTCGDEDAHGTPLEREA
jgi:hypothetical protein